MSHDVVARAAPAKVNLRLRVLTRGADGYHQLETLFCALELADTIELRRLAEPGLELEVEAEQDTGPASENLCARAARAYARAAGVPLAAAIRLVKRVPVAAGLGGGSSDAAATLAALDALHGGALGRDALLRLAGRLGADVPFFLCGSPLALAWGRGDRLLPLEPLPAREVVLAVPADGMPTAEAFHLLAERPPAAPEAGVVPEAERLDWARVAELAANDFDDVVFERRPELRELRDALRLAGARPALLAGSGAAVFGLFEDARAADAAAQELAAAADAPRVLRTRTAQR